ncbi:uncharacterized protein BDZ99DRAFT_537323 [Mytilinidion resinicola]|uniref:F-box domain-containing protein n=1 Tax=Mytilinidion resinicola TaxID=574789 RepID=A0A6A6YCN5_9PEZI|nr:uncharacterized protein BDZ99DRAFT_537323 [Mytilinidion resinicola]KAF2806596.1 hypothetical protein BDZ99DRAFT_537323 [Mytilinidion resinicola]
MNINAFPYEILAQILETAAQLNQRDGVTFTFGLSQAPLPLQKTALQRYVRGTVPPELLRWDATASIRHVCWDWHEWGLQYALKDVFIRRWKGAERWAELSQRREAYRLYELVEKPSGTAVYKDPYGSLNRTVQLLADYPEVASKIRRMWFDGFYTYGTDLKISSALRNCTNLTAVSLPWTTLRHLAAQDWAQLLIGTGAPLRSLELLAVDLPAALAGESDNQLDLRPLDSPSVDFSQLRRLKVFGNSTFMPIDDRDLQAIARTATRLEEFHLTCLSTISIDGVMAVVKSSQSTLKVLEHSPRSNDGFFHPHPGSLPDSEHLCTVLTNCTKLETVSLSVPSMCSALFANENVRWSGDLQVRAARLCGHEDGRSTYEAQWTLKRLLEQARRLVAARASCHIPKNLFVELFFADFIFEPHANAVHGDFQLAQLASGGSWPVSRSLSRKGPYGSTGLYGKDEEEPFERVDEDEFMSGMCKNWVSISA